MTVNLAQIMVDCTITDDNVVINDWNGYEICSTIYSNAKKLRIEAPPPASVQNIESTGHINIAVSFALSRHIKDVSVYVREMVDNLTVNGGVITTGRTQDFFKISDLWFSGATVHANIVAEGVVCLSCSDQGGGSKVYGNVSSKSRVSLTNKSELYGFAHAKESVGLLGYKITGDGIAYHVTSWKYIGSKTVAEVSDFNGERGESGASHDEIKMWATLLEYFDDLVISKHYTNNEIKAFEKKLTLKYWVSYIQSLLAI